MKKILLSMLAATLVVAVSQAQEIPDREAPAHEMKQKHHRGEEFKDLNLSEEQKAKLKALREESRKEREALQKNDNITVKEWRAKMEEQRKAQREKFQSILSEEQKVQLQKSKEERKARFQERAKERMEKMKAELKLTDEQSGKLKASREAMSEKIKSLREDQSLTDESRKEQVKELMKKQKEEMKSILTEEQLKKLEEKKRHRHSRKKIV
jgi:Spy/CpxP family protein refolding chaperone